MNAPTDPQRADVLRLEELAQTLGVSLSQGEERQRRLTLLKRALISRPWAKKYGKRSNAYLEWLGDAIWSHAIVEEVLASYGKKDIYYVEGWRYTLASGEEQYQVAKNLGIDTLVKIPEGYQPTKTTHKVETERVIIGSALEAILGAIACWGKREAIECARRLVHERMNARTFIKIREVIKGADHARFLDISSCEQILGFTRLNVFVTYELTQMKDVTLGGAYRARQAMLNTHGLALLARAVKAATQENTDVQAMQRLLAKTGKGRKLEEDVKYQMSARLAACVNELQTYELTQYKPHTAPSTDKTSQLKTLMQTRGLRLETLSRVRGGGNSREVTVTYRIRGQKIAEAAGKTYVEAAERASALALASPLFEKLLQP